MDTAALIIVLVIALALFFDFTNGFHDTANAMATPIATGALKPKVAVLLAAVLNLVGAFLSTEVSRTISHGIIREDEISASIFPALIFAGLIGAVTWNMLTWLLGLPSSSSHALFGGLIGATIVGVGFAAINFGTVLSKVILPALIAPFTAGVIAFLVTRMAYAITRRSDSKPDGRDGFRWGQIFTSSLVALAHGTSDGQKTMGVITLVLIAGGYQAVGSGPHWWVILAAGVAIGLGTYSGGWRIMRTLGKGIVDIDTPQGATSGAATTATILASSHLGFGLSTTHVATGAILGSGVGRDGAEVRWGLARKLVVAWLLTLPGAAIIGGLAALLAGTGAVGSVLLLVLLAAVCVIIFLVSRRNQVTSHNVTDSREVMVLASATPSTYPEDPRLAPIKPAGRSGGRSKGKKKKIKSGV